MSKGKILVIAEKPSVALDIAKALGSFEKKNGFYENQDYIVSHALGHITRLYTPEEYDETYKNWSLGNLPIIPKEFKLKPTDKQFNVLKSIINRKDVLTIVNACDAGREGELIFREILSLVPSGAKGKSLKRLWLSAMTKNEILKEFKNLKDASHFDSLADSAFARSHADWLVGINATESFSCKWNTLLSIGRVQTPTLNIIVGRELEIKNFKPEVYFELEGNFLLKSFAYKGKYILDGDTKFKGRSNLDSLLKKISSAKKGVIKDVKESVASEIPPLLYDLTELQRDANKSFGFTAQKTLNIAQVLYERYKLTTYPRTDSRYLPNSLKDTVPVTLKKVSNIGDYKKFIDKIIGNIKFSSRIIDDSKISDHYAIIPTGETYGYQNLGKDEKLVYDLIVKRFISVFYEPAKYRKFSFMTDVNSAPFSTDLSILEFSGWKEVYGEKSSNVPLFKNGSVSDVKEFNVLEKQTEPPSRYTDATLLSAMEHAGHFVDDDKMKEILKERGIGTPSTRAAIIERLIKVGYVERKGRSLVPTQKGIDLISIIGKVNIDVLLSPSMTGDWEGRLKRIEENKEDSGKFIKDIESLTKNIVKSVSDFSISSSHSEALSNYIGKCPVCGGDVTEKAKAYSCNKCDFVIWKVVKGKPITRDLAKNLINGGIISIGKVKTKDGSKTFTGNMKIAEDGHLTFVFPENNSGEGKAGFSKAKYGGKSSKSSSRSSKYK